MNSSATAVSYLTAVRVKAGSQLFQCAFRETTIVSRFCMVTYLRCVFFEVSLGVVQTQYDRVSKCFVLLPAYCLVASFFLPKLILV
jgi:hypothetical protein